MLVLSTHHSRNCARDMYNVSTRFVSDVRLMQQLHCCLQCHVLKLHTKSQVQGDANTTFRYVRLSEHTSSMSMYMVYLINDVFMFVHAHVHTDTQSLTHARTHHTLACTHVYKRQLRFSGQLRWRNVTAVGTIRCSIPGHSSRAKPADC